MKHHSVIIASAIMVACTALSLPATAMDRAEVETLAKILGLTKDIPPGEVTIAAIYNPNSAESVEDLKNFLNTFRKPVTGPHHTLHAVGLSTSDLSSLGSNRVAVLLNGLTPAQQEQIRNSTKGKKTLTATSNTKYVEDYKAILGVSVGSVVKVLVNRELLASSKLTFDVVFQFMVTEI